MKQPRLGDSDGFHLLGEQAALEVELTAEDWQALCRPRAIDKPRQGPVPWSGRQRMPVPESPEVQTSWARIVTAARSLQLPAPRVALALGIAGATAVMASAVYLSSRPTSPALAAMDTMLPPEAPVERPPPAPAGEPVRYANPFDAAEVFEFPPGTSEIEARDAVANLLMERARGRHASLSVKRGGRKNI